MLEATQKLVGKEHVESSRNVVRASRRAVNKQCPDFEISIAYYNLPRFYFVPSLLQAI